VIEEVERRGMAEQVLLKSPPQERLLKKFESYPKKHMYMPIVQTPEEYRLARAFDVNMVAAEVIFRTAEDPTADPLFIREIRSDGVLAWCNSLKLSDRHFLCGDYDDDVSILEGPEQGWGKILDMGFDIVQTDWPSLLRDYLAAGNE
jgi:glycerophosphoryl diester phosphodiesterase